MSKYFNWPSSLKRLVRFDAARAEDVNDALDELTAGLDQLDLDTDRSIKLPIGTADQTLAMTSGQRANLLLAFDSSGNIAAVTGGGRFRGDWLTATAYVISDYFRDPVSKNIYSVVAAHTSGVLATDISAGRVQLAINVEDVEAAKTAAQNAATTATTQAGVATTQAGTATTQAGVATTQAGVATTQAGVATTQAGIATSAAGTATTQAGIATTKAAEAAASAASIAGGPVPEAPSDGKTYGRKDAAWAEAAPLASPALTGVPTAPTAAVGTNTTQLATTAHVFAERAATATLTNKTLSADSNTISGIAASSFVLSNASGNLNGSAAQKVIPAGVVVGTTDAQTLTNKTLTTPLITGTCEVQVAMPANAIDLATGNLFTKTISGATTLTVSNVPTTGTAASFILEVTNAGSAAITWFFGVKWAGGTAPTLTASGVDVLGFYSHDGGTKWHGFLLSKDSK